MFLFDPHENIRKPLVFWCFQGDQKEENRNIWKKKVNLSDKFWDLLFQ